MEKTIRQATWLLNNSKKEQTKRLARGVIAYYNKFKTLSQKQIFTIDKLFRNNS
jgi:hypothetical protein